MNDPLEDRPRLRRRAAQESPPLGQPVRDDRLREPRHRPERGHLGANRGCSRFEFADALHDRGDIACAVLDEPDECLALPLDFGRFAFKGQSRFPHVVALRGRNRQLNRFGRQRVPLDFREHRFIHLLDRQAERVRTGAIGAMAMADVFRNSAALLAAALDRQPTAAEAALREPGKETHGPVLRGPTDETPTLDAQRL